MNPFRTLVLIVWAAIISASMSVAPADSTPCSPQSNETTRVLVPVLADRLSGANSSLWVTDVWLSNTTDCPLVFLLAPCTVSCCCAELNTYAAQSMSALQLDQPHGQWFSIPVDDALQFQARLRDLSRTSSSAGVEFPIVRDTDFRDHQVNLLGVPRDPRFRVTLRLYGMSAGTALRVEIMDPFGTVIASQAVPLDPPVEVFGGTIPAYAQLSLAPGLTNEEPTRIRITGHTTGARFWAFASVTNNESSEVTIVQPSR